MAKVFLPSRSPIKFRGENSLPLASYPRVKTRGYGCGHPYGVLHCSNKALIQHPRLGETAVQFAKSPNPFILIII